MQEKVTNIHMANPNRGKIIKEVCERGRGELNFD